MSKKNFVVSAAGTIPQDKLLKKFKRMADACGVTKKYRQMKEYKKPSERLKEKRAAAEKRRNKLNKRGYDRNRI